jgi:hypothetical protein
MTQNNIFYVIFFVLYPYHTRMMQYFEMLSDSAEIWYDHFEGVFFPQITIYDLHNENCRNTYFHPILFKLHLLILKRNYGFNVPGIGRSDPTRSWKEHVCLFIAKRRVVKSCVNFITWPTQVSPDSTQSGIRLLM